MSLSRPSRPEPNLSWSSLVKRCGYHIPARFVQPVNTFNRDWLSPYLNCHRPCLLPTEVIEAKGRARKRYPVGDDLFRRTHKAVAAAA